MFFTSAFFHFTSHIHSFLSSESKVIFLNCDCTNKNTIASNICLKITKILQNVALSWQKKAFEVQHPSTGSVWGGWSVWIASNSQASTSPWLWLGHWTPSFWWRRPNKEPSSSGNWREWTLPSVAPEHVMESIFCHSMMVWYGHCTVQDRRLGPAGENCPAD